MVAHIDEALQDAAVQQLFEHVGGDGLAFCGCRAVLTHEWPDRMAVLRGGDLNGPAIPRQR